jgi:predicted RNA-binding protein associated with RNAse of E/G family
MDLGFVILDPDDRWTEYFFADRWYNIFEIRAGDGFLKGWYCNITRPAYIGPDEVAAEDLALDLWVTPGGDMQVLDEDEFAALALSSTEREAARKALADLQARVTRRDPPFSEVADE